MDTNGDQRLTSEEGKDWEHFDEVDTDDDDVATGREIRAFLQKQRR